MSRRYIIRVIAPDGYTLGNDVTVRLPEGDLDEAVHRVFLLIEEAERYQDEHGDVQREHP